MKKNSMYLDKVF